MHAHRPYIIRNFISLRIQFDDYNFDDDNDDAKDNYEDEEEEERSVESAQLIKQ